MTRKINRATSVTQPVTLRGRPTRPSYNVFLLLLVAHARFSIRKKKGKIRGKWQNSFRRWISSGNSRIIDSTNERVLESSSEMSQWDDVPRISPRCTVFPVIHRFHRQAKTPVSPYTRSSAYSSLIYLFVAKLSSSSSARDEVFPRFLSWSMTRDSASRFYARLVSHTCARHCDIRDYLGLCKCVEDTRARAHSWAARCWLKPFRFTSRPRFKKLSLSLTFGSIVYRLSNDPLRFPFPRSLVSFFFQWFEALIEVNLSTKYVYIHSSMCKSDIDCTRIRFPIHFRSKIYIFARYKNSLYPVIWRRRIIFIYIFRHCVHELNMKYRGGGVSRFTILNPSEISKRTKSRDFFRTRRRRYQ